MLTLSYLSELYLLYSNDYSKEVRRFELCGRYFPDPHKPNLMGVINLSSESWYRESVALDSISAVRKAKILQASGADIVDIGAESSLSYAQRIDDIQQLELLLPIIKELSTTGILISVETYHLNVAKGCFKAGAAILNLTKGDNLKEFFKVVADYDGGVIINFVRGDNVREVQPIELPKDPLSLLFPYFEKRIEEALSCGVRKIWLDPGLGFYYPNLLDGPTRIQRQMEIFLHTFRLRKFGWPICHALPHAFECFQDEVRTAEAFFALLAILGKTDLLRTHEINKVLGVVKTMQLFSSKNP
ncbi:dihydropteroate synthase [Candidatus Methylacidiphilum fumarolicum]|uniref:Dihydropteroate synthase or related enzyme n=2 Tax=Candidatus Methylacidiphilum fumarolicum TaxID=591154 RepID=I0K122_METFB|nr:dihydropteroate synthase [Candidatus Methylacidiphilum fumarolicum]MBW6413941.1 dihydropteroate synthase [Candidatus Methylacidiphilum fumarolicum]TFE70486.1 dihydropteroate synthase [Candidatus Methylacidiphilum fumarolicum]TFE74795.1 dihydropteroate synthase [Candidatus Methylacidiphilum fumarolicum]TFE76041.1 dihydropteroate synthase [Candidatus Methylacidiphilum fumarolicum]TFE76374.1 dihydropteroate synthase [Candidatus Methylacidiphilum fumarolicum]